MSNRKYKMSDGQKGSALAVRITPRASSNEIAEVLDDGTIRVRLAAPPTDNDANDALLVYLSEILGVPQSQLEIVAGSDGRDKLVSVIDMDVEMVHQRILAHLG
ncbi:MAG TPA: DUF167 domain-containing protein [Anaerolineales bacterium]|nr:DUF167 domain-containing protein [Anaerolineales bacterium]